MPAIENIAVTEVKLFRHASEAPPNTLLQIRVEERPVVVIRANFRGPSGVVRGVVFAEGDQAGLLSVGYNLLSAPALDISEMLILNIVQPAPQSIGMRGNAVAGDLCDGQHSDQQRCRCMAIRFADDDSNGNLFGYLLLTGDNAGAVSVLDDVLILGKSVVRDRLVIGSPILRR